VKKPPSDKSQGVPEEIQVTEPNIVSRLQRSFSTNFMINIQDRRISTDSLVPKCRCSKILIVDDNPFNTMAFEAVLGSLNVKCDSVYDGQTAIDKLLKRQKTHCGNNCKPYCVIFMDQEMPGMTGSQTVREIKRLEAEELIPPMKIVGCTAHGSNEEMEKFMEPGIDLCIHKPVMTQDLQRIPVGHELF